MSDNYTYNSDISVNNISEIVKKRVLARAKSLKSNSNNSNKEVPVDASLKLFFKLDFMGNIDYINPNLCNLLGYDNSEIIGKSSDLITHPDLPNCLYESYVKKLALYKPFAVIAKVLTKDGGCVWLKMHFSTSIDERNKMVTYSVRAQKTSDNAKNKLNKLYSILSKIEKKTGDTIASKRYLVGLFEDTNLTFDEYVASFCDNPSKECLELKKKTKGVKHIIAERISTISYNPDMDMYH